MSQKGRRVPPPDPDAIRGGQVTNMLPNEDAWNEAEQHRTLDAHLVATGTVQNRATGQWHTWVSLYGADLTSWYVGDDGATARAMLAAIQKLFSEWAYTEDDVESMNALLAVAHEMSTDPRATLPDAQVRELLAEVAARQLRKN
jgi:hypothetical protein